MLKTLIDVDTGIDDSIAILYALKNKEIRVEGITTGFGNTGVRQATENTLRLLRLARAPYDVPVAMGASGPLSGVWNGPVTEVHGDNGIGNVRLPEAVQKPLQIGAAELIRRKAEELSGELVFVALGRLTNLANALKGDPGLCKKIRRVIIMGGTLFAPGNVTETAEANIQGDPEAADYVFHSDLPITLVGLDVTMATRLKKVDIAKLEEISSRENRSVVRYVQEVLSFYFDFYAGVDGFEDDCPVHDPLAVMVAANPDLVSAEAYRLHVCTSSENDAGTIVIDRKGSDQNSNPIAVCLKVDSERAVRELLSILAGRTAAVQ